MKKKIVVNEVFESIDESLIEEGIPIANRYMKAIGEVSQFFGDVPIPISPDSLLPNNEFGNQLCVWLDDWYDKKYGKLQHIKSDLGFLYQKFRGDLWHYRVPSFYGNCNFFIDKDLTVLGANNETNILRMSQNMTQAYVNSLEEKELTQLIDSYGNALEVWDIFSCWSLTKIPFCQSIKADLCTIQTQLDTQRMDYAQARWAYLQCAEKILKAWLLKAGLTEKELKNKYGHRIHKLVNAFNLHYKENLSLNGLESIKCSAGARYGDENFTSDDIIDAQEWLFKLIKTIGFEPTLATI